MLLVRKELSRLGFDQGWSDWSLARNTFFFSFDRTSRVTVANLAYSFLSDPVLHVIKPYKTKGELARTQ